MSPQTRRTTRTHPKKLEGKNYSILIFKTETMYFLEVLCKKYRSLFPPPANANVGDGEKKRFDHFQFQATQETEIWYAGLF